MGGEGASMTSRMFFGGWLYPDAASTGVAGTEDAFDRDAPGCAAIGTDIAQKTSAATKRQFRVFLTGIPSLPFNSLANPTYRILRGFG
jgi:hypothetical protein